jgi:hypothetical protein
MESLSSQLHFNKCYDATNTPEQRLHQPCRGRGIAGWMILNGPELAAAMPRPYPSNQFKIQNSKLKISPLETLRLS